jgi:hypothetical protein
MKMELTEIEKVITMALRYRKQNIIRGGVWHGGTINTGWDGGSRDTWYILRNRMIEMASSIPDPNRQGDPHGQRRVLSLPEGTTHVVRGGTFMGKPATLTVWEVKT